ncbi:MAG TPA: sodium:alanine symporter family protein [Candidatus Eubacterium faecale]|uniref:Sodium:alanine symporter family protein n=1 Tax=Candidatus Eubacterium faecale TaxID=2838568 RepID=A0A9D2MJU3_9FIRM|nr:sodium:alanine symporter family protein [Candidatus Eubacterium faecale]
MEKLGEILDAIDGVVWGPVMLVFLVGTGIFLTFKLNFLPWRNLPKALKMVFSPESRKTDKGKGDISPFSALMTALAGTIGTGNIVGVATAMITGGPGALVWMWIAAAFGISTKYAECALAIKYRETNSKGEMCGGPMYTIKNAFKHKKIALILAGAFAVFTVLASFGIGNMSQANSISSSLTQTFSIPSWITGIVLAVLTGIIIFGGIKSISKVSSVLVPVMAVFYIISGLVVIIANYKNIPAGLGTIWSMAFGGKAVAGGLAGTLTVSVMQSIRYGVSRGVFSNEAGLGSAAITASSVTTDSHVNQGYINMCGTFIDTIVVCSITGLVIASSGLLGSTDANGVLLDGADLTLASFESVLGKPGAVVVSIGILLFAWSTILGWEYQGEKALEYLFKNRAICYIYRIVFAVMVFFGSVAALDVAWSFSDIANGLMAVPNLISLIVLSGFLRKDTIAYHKLTKRSKQK